MSGSEYYQFLVNGNHSKAIRILDKALQELEQQLNTSPQELTQSLKHQIAQLYHNKAQVFVQLELVKKAGEAFQKAIETDETHQTARLGIAQLLSKFKFKYKDLSESNQHALKHLDFFLQNIQISTSPESILQASNLQKQIKLNFSNNQQIPQNNIQSKSQQIQNNSDKKSEELNKNNLENSNQNGNQNQVDDISLKLEQQNLKAQVKKGEQIGKNTHITMNQSQIRNMQQGLLIEGSQNVQNIVENASSEVASKAVQLVNQGKLVEAETLLNKELNKNPRNFAALLARGTCFAVQGRYKEAEVDFKLATEIIPNYVDARRRRAQVLTALGKLQEAVKEFDTALEISGDKQERASLHAERGKVHQTRRNLIKAHFDLEEASKILTTSPELFDHLGVTRTALGDIESALEAFEASIRLKSDNATVWLHKATTLKESARTEEADHAIDQVLKIEKQKGDEKCSLLALKLRGSMRQWQGRHGEASNVVNEAIKIVKSSSMQASLELLAELHYLRAVCLMAHGKFTMARRDFDECLDIGPKVAAAVQKRNLSLHQQQQSLIESQQVGQQMFLAWYMRELSSYYNQRLDEPVENWSMDRELPALFKQGWCRKELVNEELVRQMQANWPVINYLNINQPTTDPPDSSVLLPMLDMAEKIGQLVQYNHRGFFSNKRQQRAIGFAALELAQALQIVLQARAKGRMGSVKIEGSSKQGAPKQGSKQEFGWRDAMDIIVKWRQIAEPNDQVLWVDGLTEEAFKQGFGSHTPMFSGQTKCMRYYSRFPRAFQLFKSIAVHDGFVKNAKDDKIKVDPKEVDTATDCRSMWLAVKKTNCYVVVKIQSEFQNLNKGVGIGVGSELEVKTEKQEGEALNAKDFKSPDNKTQLKSGDIGANEVGGKEKSGVRVGAGVLEGTRLTITSGDDDSGFGIPEDSYEFSIRTPVTPPRWKLFDAELTHAFKSILEASETGDKTLATNAILRFVYYWYNFMPLARGSAACGYASLLGMFMALDMPISTQVPEGVQVDWEAILATSPNQFINAVESWLAPQQQIQGQFERWRSFPMVKDVLGTVRQRIYVMDYPNGVWEAM